MCPEEGDQVSGRPRGQDLGGVAEVAWFVQLGEGGRETSRILQLPQGGQWEGSC